MSVFFFVFSELHRFFLQKKTSKNFFFLSNKSIEQATEINEFRTLHIFEISLTSVFCLHQFCVLPSTVFFFPSINFQRKQKFWVSNNLFFSLFLVSFFFYVASSLVKNLNQLNTEKTKINGYFKLWVTGVCYFGFFITVIMFKTRFHVCLYFFFCFFL